MITYIIEVWFLELIKSFQSVAVAWKHFEKCFAEFSLHKLIWSRNATMRVSCSLHFENLFASMEMNQNAAVAVKCL